jgi:hypothetical protein
MTVRVEPGEVVRIDWNGWQPHSHSILRGVYAAEDGFALHHFVNIGSLLRGIFLDRYVLLKVVTFGHGYDGDSAGVRA